MAEESERELKLSEMLDWDRIIQVKGQGHDKLFYAKAIVHNNKFMIVTPLFQNGLNQRFAVSDTVFLKKKTYGDISVPDILDIMFVHLKGQPYKSKTITKKFRDTILLSKSNVTLNHFAQVVSYYNYIVNQINN